jgi:hypothetical protein
MSRERRNGLMIATTFTQRAFGYIEGVLLRRDLGRMLSKGSLRVTEMNLEGMHHFHLALLLISTECLLFPCE